MVGIGERASSREESDESDNSDEHLKPDIHMELDRDWENRTNEGLFNHLFLF